MSASSLPCMACRVVGLSRPTLRSLCASPAGALRPSWPSRRRAHPALAGGRLPVVRCASRSTAHLVLPGSQPSSFFRVVQRSPLRRHHLRCPLPASGMTCARRETVAAPPEPSAQGSPALRSFRPRGLSPPRRLAPPTARRLVASCCRPWGSSGFCAPPSADWRPALPHRCQHPPEHLRDHSRDPVARTRSPLVVAGPRPR
jgi:hypothetical protein